LSSGRVAKANQGLGPVSLFRLARLSKGLAAARFGTFETSSEGMVQESRHVDRADRRKIGGSFATDLHGNDVYLLQSTGTN
jgi:hypothetical protein